MLGLLHTFDFSKLQTRSTRYVWLIPNENKLWFYWNWKIGICSKEADPAVLDITLASLHHENSVELKWFTKKCAYEVKRSPFQKMFWILCANTSQHFKNQLSNPEMYETQKFHRAVFGPCFLDKKNKKCIL